MKVLNVIKNVICVMAGILLIGVIGMMILQIKPAVVVSGSMEPTISTGSLAFIDTKDKEIKEGDIIAFQTGGQLVTHRALEKVSGGWITKGDANSSRDVSPVREENLVGKTVMWVPFAGRIVRYADSVPGVITIVTLCIVLVLPGIVLKGHPEKA